MAEHRFVNADTYEVTYRLSQEVVKTDVIRKGQYAQHLFDTLHALEQIIAVTTNVSVVISVRTNQLSTVEYTQRTEWTSGNIVYTFGDNASSIISFNQRGSNDILTGLKSWHSAFESVWVELYGPNRSSYQNEQNHVPDYSEVLPGLFVGSVDAVRYLYNNQMVKRVINCAEELSNVADVPDDSYLSVKLNDSGTVNDQGVLADNVQTIMAFLERDSLNESPVLIHCQMGISRSPSVAAAYLLHTGQCFTVSEAKRTVKTARPVSFEGCAKYTYDSVLVELFE